MAFVKDYTFHNMARIGNDDCDLSQRNVQNLKSGNYALTNYFSNDCTMKNSIQMATNQPSMFFTGSHQTGVGGCNIDENSNLFHSLLSKPACKISLMQRPFSTVPFLGKGPGDVMLESKIQNGEWMTDKKSIGTTSETSHIKYRNYPLLPALQATITNPANLVEGDAAEGWIRGGLPSRDFTRDYEYSTKCQY